MDQDQQSRLKELIAKGKEQGFLTYTEVNDHLPDGIVEPEQIEDIIRMINDMGIKVHESAPTETNEILSDTETEPDEDAAEEAAAALASLDSEFGRTTDPVRMYMREMGTVELLTREGEIKIARRIENGLNQAMSSLARYPDTMRMIFERYNEVREEEAKLSDIMVGFVDPMKTRIRFRCRRPHRTPTTTMTTPSKIPAPIRKKPNSASPRSSALSTAR